MRILCAFAFASCALILAGCSGTLGTTATSTASNSLPGTPLRGVVHGGQNPISGAHVYLMALNTTGYGGPGIAASNSNKSSSLLNASTGNPADGNGNYYVITGSDGSFSITGDYSCPADKNFNTYYYSTGGDSGSGANLAATLIGPAPACNSSNFTVVNEVSTIASGYAFAGFITDPLHVGSSGSALALTALNNTDETLGNLYSLTTGAALATTPAGNGTVPQAEIDTLANILAACINSNGANTGPTNPTPCYTLFNNAKNGSTVPTDTATAATNIVHNPGANVANLFSLQTANSPFQPMLSAAPNDFTIAITYTGGGLNISNDLAIDAAGNVWVTNGNGNNVSEFGPDGTPAANSPFSGGGLAHPGPIAIDGNGNVWAANQNNNTISGLSSSGAVIPISPISNGGLSDPTSLAIDSSGFIWASNYGASSISKFTILGAAATGAPFSGGGLSHPYQIAIDLSGNVWATNPNSNVVSELNSSGSPVSSTGYSTGGLNAPEFIAIDGSGNAWADNDGGGSAGFFTVYNQSGTAISGATGYSGGGLDDPGAVAIDGAGNVWATSGGVPGWISELNASGTLITGSQGYQSSGLNHPSSIAVDGSGNVWVTNVYFGANSITEFVGAATPVVTPIVANLRSPYGAHAVNEP